MTYRHFMNRSDMITPTCGGRLHDILLIKCLLAATKARIRCVGFISRLETRTSLLM